jgi:hypothetical protein
MEYVMSTKQGQHPKGYWMGISLSIGMAIGAALGAALENVGAGIALGIAAGAGIGASLEQKNRVRTRPLSAQEKKMQKWGAVVGLAVLLTLAALLIEVPYMINK